MLRLEEGNGEDDLGVINGMGCAWNPPDQYDCYGTVFGRVCCDNSIARHNDKDDRFKVKSLYQHEPPFGRVISVASTKDGLPVRIRPTVTDENRERMKYIRDEVVDALSIGFDPITWTVHSDILDDWGWPVWEFTEIELREVSPVTWGAVQGAIIEDVRMLARMQEQIQRAPQTPAELKAASLQLLETWRALASRTGVELTDAERADLAAARSHVRAVLELAEARGEGSIPDHPEKKHLAPEQSPDGDTRLEALFGTMGRLTEQLSREPENDAGAGPRVDALFDRMQRLSA